MTANFTITRLAGVSALVEGTDVRGNDGQMIVSTAEWDEITRRDAHSKAHQDFDAKVEKFFAPLLEAADKLRDTHKISTDPLLYIVEQEASEGRAPQQEVLRNLSRDSVILRAIETGHSDRLIWVGDELVLTAAPAASADTAEDTDDEAPEQPAPNQGFASE